MNNKNLLIRTLDTGIFGLDGGSMFGVVPKVLWTKAYSEPDEENRIPLAARPLLIQYDTKTILVDTGNGAKFNEKMQKIYKIDLNKSNILNALNSIGLQKEDITDVILTHLHFDHCGGSTSMVDGNIVPTFPNAIYHIQLEQWEWALKPTEKDTASFIPNDFLPLNEHKVIKFLDGNFKFNDFIELITFFGHTPAMQGVKVNLNGQIYFYPADLFPTSAHLNLPYILAYDNYPLTTLKEKKEILEKIIEEDWIVIFEHDAFVKAGKIGYEKGKYFVREKIDL
ncbi:MAG: MBL fold metallo-hydrolase [Ignavibacteria bacterium]|nr:MBL fold metallo-hydrolase [Ignavibacteria bacterium]